MAAYAHPEVLVETDWLANHLDDPKIRVAEVDYDSAANYELGHLPGAVLFDWRKDINDPVRRDILSREALTELFRRAGIDPETTVVLYGDFNNWFAAFAFWVFTYYGAKHLKILNGGRKKWIAEDRPLTKDAPHPTPGKFEASPPDPKLRVFLEDVRAALPHVKDGKAGLVDVRGPKEFSGEITAPPEYPTEHAQRGGHIPGAKNIPWAQAVRDDGTFKSREELDELYRSKGLAPDEMVITYCRIGERSSHTWFVLKYLLGYRDVRNYDGSWTEWGNLVRTPIEKP
jgi:thiosulfate/3-mercaptopyruvate sulfurtransferase